MRVHQSTPVPPLGPDAEIVIAATGELVLRSRGRFALVDGLRGDDLRAVLREIDGTRTVAAAIAALSDRYEEPVVRGLLDAVHDLTAAEPADPVFRAAAAPPLREVIESPVVIVGNGRLSAGLVSHLRMRGFAAVRQLDTSAFASVRHDRFRRAREERIVARHGAVVDDGAYGEHSVDGLAREVAGAGLVVCALEGTFFRGVLDVNAACVAARTPALLVTVDADAVHLGPSYVPGLSACFECVNASAPEPMRTSLELFSTYTLAEGEPLDRVCELVATEAQALLAAALPPQLVTRLVSVPRRAPLAPLTQVTPVMPAAPGHCVCNTGAPEDLPRHLQVNADLSLVNSRVDEPRVSAGPEDVPDPYRTVGVIGGGTAGYFAALAIKAKLPHLDVTLVESSQIPIIGVGESTTPDIVYFLHGDLGFDLHEFYCAVRPTWKMGIKFFWGQPGEYYFNEPFARPRHSEALHYDGDINASSFVSRLMSRELGPLIETDRGPAFLLERLAQPQSAYPHWCAYHLDNKRFVAYLAEQARKRGIPYIDAKVAGAVKTPDGEEIDYLVTDDGRRLKFDLFIDCTGFRSALLEKEMGARFLSFEKSLFTDMAVVAEVPHGGHLKPYTLAESMECGWCWNIPQEESDHRGYVFSSRFCTVEEAAAEMRRKNPDMSDYWTVKFRSGRHDEFWKGNVIAIGNSYGFVEPLESTAIQIVIIELQTLIRNFPKRKSERLAKNVIASRVAGAWDYIRWFLSIHYRFNRKFSNPFWEACWNDTDISGMADLVELFQERAPLLTRPDVDLVRTRLTSDDLTFNLALVDTMLLGQGVCTATLEPPTESHDAWRQRAAATERLLARAVSQRRALEILRERPEILGSIKISGII